MVSCPFIRAHAIHTPMTSALHNELFICTSRIELRGSSSTQGVVGAVASDPSGCAYIFYYCCQFVPPNGVPGKTTPFLKELGLEVKSIALWRIWKQTLIVCRSLTKHLCGLSRFAKCFTIFRSTRRPFNPPGRFFDKSSV